jgi:hypothetical protein
MEEQVSSQSVTGPSSSTASRRPIIIVLAVIGILAVILGILYFVAAGSLPDFLVGKVHGGHHWVRGLVSLVVGVAFLAAAWLVQRRPAK